jgi:hypothetical protein
MSAVAQKANSRGPRVPLLNTPTVPPEPEQTSHAPAGTPELDAAVLIVQASATKLMRNATGQIQNRVYGYVTLDAVVDEVLPLLVEQDLLWRCFPTILEGEPALRYRMTHVASGEYDEDTMSLMIAMPNPQGQGSALTYARRYALTAYLNLTVDADDDGAVATATAGQAEGAPAASSKSSKPKLASPAQQGMLEKKARAAGLTAGDFANVVLVAGGDPPRAWHDGDHAARVLKDGLERLSAGLVDTVIAGIAEAHAAAAGGGTER